MYLSDLIGRGIEKARDRDNFVYWRAINTCVKMSGHHVLDDMSMMSCESSNNSTVTVFDDDPGYERRLVVEKLESELALAPETSRFLLTRHSAEEISRFALVYEKLFQQARSTTEPPLWLYPLREEDFESAQRLGTMQIRFAWCTTLEKDVYAIGDAFYTLFTNEERADLPPERRLYRLFSQKKQRSCLTHILTSPSVPANQFASSSTTTKRRIKSALPVVLFDETKTKTKKRARDLSLIVANDSATSQTVPTTIASLELQLQIGRAQVAEMEAQRKLSELAYERRLDQIQMERIKEQADRRVEQVEAENRALKEREQIKESELRLRDKEIELLREKEQFHISALSHPTTITTTATTRLDRPNKRVKASPLPYSYSTDTAPVFQQPGAEFQLRCHQRLQPMRDQHNKFVLAVEVDNMYYLRDIIAKLLLINTNTTTDPDLQRVLSSPLLDENRIFLCTNALITPDVELRTREILSPHSLSNRLNMANIQLHYAMLIKALELNAMECHVKNTERGHDICVATDVPFHYGQDVLRAWYPCFTSGQGTIISESLRFYARSFLRGPGLNKCCQFCEQTFVCYSTGAYKNAHHLDGCDVLAQYSNDECRVLEAIIYQKSKSEAFAKHPLIADPTSSKCLMRFATDKEIAAGIYVTDPMLKAHPLKGDPRYRVRLKMQLYLQMRCNTWVDFTQRLCALATRPDKLYNINAVPLPHLLDVFSGHGAGTTTGSGKKSKATPVSASSRSRVSRPPVPKDAPEEVKAYEQLRQKVRGTFLGEILLNFDGANYLDNLRQRDFTYNERTGFGDGMYFQTREERALHERDAAREHERRMAEISAMATMIPLPPPEQPAVLLPPLDFSKPIFIPPLPVPVESPAPPLLPVVRRTTTTTKEIPSQPDPMAQMAALFHTTAPQEIESYDGTDWFPSSIVL